MPDLNINFKDLDAVSRLQGELKNLLEVRGDRYTLYRTEWEINLGLSTRYSDTLFDSKDLNDDLRNQMQKAYESWLRVAISNTIQLLQNLGVKFTEDEKKEMGVT